MLVQQLLADCCACKCALQGAEGGPESGGSTYIISLAGAVKGRLEEAHLGDHPAAVQALAECVSEGTDLGDLMVLERMQVRRHHSPLRHNMSVHCFPTCMSARPMTVLGMASDVCSAVTGRDYNCEGHCISSRTVLLCVLLLSM